MKKANFKYLFLLTIVILSLLITVGCGDKDKKDDKKDTAKKTETEAPYPTPGAWATAEEIEEYEAKIASTIELEKAADKYEYEQKTNIVDDNYDNYYQIFVYSFCDSNSDGIGDLNGITSKLDYIKDMGFTGIWLTPIFEAREYHKYHTLDYYEIDPQFGTMADFEKLVTECNSRGINLILDLVLNHTSTAHEWYKSAFDSIAAGTENSNKYFKYYNFQTEEKENFYKVGQSSYFIEGSFASSIPDLCLMNTDVRKEFEQIAKFWLDKGIGGFRLDAALHYEESNTPKNVEILTWFNDYVKGINPDAYIVAEVWTGVDEYMDYYESGIDSVFDFAFAGTTGVIASTLRSGGGANDYEESMVGLEEKFTKFKSDSACIDAPFTTNHDMARVSGYFSDNSDKKIKMALAMCQMLSGSSFVYYGEEIGMQGSGASDVNFRAPMYWSATDTAITPKAVSGCTVKPADHIYGSVEEQMESATSIYSYTKRLLELRNENPEISRGTTKVMKGIEDDNIIAIEKTYEGKSVYIIMNISKYAKEVTVSKDDFKYEGIRGYVSADEYAVSLDKETLRMPGCSVVILK